MVFYCNNPTRVQVIVDGVLIIFSQQGSRQTFLGTTQNRPQIHFEPSQSESRSPPLRNSRSIAIKTVIRWLANKQMQLYAIQLILNRLQEKNNYLKFKLSDRRIRTTDRSVSPAVLRLNSPAGWLSLLLTITKVLGNFIISLVKS